MNRDEFERLARSKGYVSTSDGALSHHSHVVPKAPPSAPGSGERGQDPETEFPHTELQEQQTLADEGSPGQPAEAALPDYEPGVSAVDDESRATYRITVTLFVSDNLRRDPTGALETICDTLVHTARRLRARVEGRELESGKGGAGGRRRKNRDRAPDVKGPLPF